MTRIAWVCLVAGLLACGVAAWNRWQADAARAAAEQAIDLAARAVENATYAAAVSEAERRARVWCQAQGQKIAGLQIQYADGEPARVAVLCSSDLNS